MGCGTGVPEATSALALGGGEGIAKLILTVQNPEEVSDSLSQCTITSSPSITPVVADIPTGESSFSVDISLTAETEYTLTAECVDSNETTNNVPVGTSGSATVTPVVGDNTAMINTLYLNLALRASGDALYCRVSQDTSSETQLLCAFNGTLTDAQKSTAVCNVELDTGGTRTTPGVVSADNSNGFVSGTKAGPYVVMGTGVTRPACYLYDANGNKTLRMYGSWTTDASGNTVMQCAMGVRQMEENIDSNRTGRFAAVCSLTGNSAWVSIPSSGMAEFDTIGGGDEDVAELVDEGGSCTPENNGAECSSGYCADSGLCAELPDGVWQSSQTIDSTGDVGIYSSLALDSNNKVHVAYYDQANTNLKYATNASGSWIASTIDSTGDVGNYASIAVDSNDKVHMSYYDSGGNSDLKYATNTSGSWIYTTLDSDGSVGAATSIAIDSNDKVHISYADATGKGVGGDLNYATNTSGSWVVSTIDFTSGVGNSTSIALDSRNNAHISYVADYSIVPRYLKYATNASGSWVHTDVDYATGYEDGGSIAVDGNDNVYISYSFFADLDYVKYATNASGSWVTAAILESISSGGGGTSVTISGNGMPYIIYSGGGVLNLAYQQ